MNKKNTQIIYLITLLIPVLFYISSYIWNNSDTILGILLILLMFISVFASLGWSIFLILKFKSLKFRVIPLIFISILPFLDIFFKFRYTIPEFFKAEKTFEAYTDGPLSSASLTLRKNYDFKLSSGGIFGYSNYYGFYEYKNDTISLFFYEKHPDYIKRNPAKWKIEDNNKIISYIETGLTFRIKKDIIKQKTPVSSSHKRERSY